MSDSMRIRRQIGKDTSSHSPTPARNPFKTRGFGNGMQARSAELPTTNLLQKRSVRPPTQQSSQPQETPDLDVQLKQAEQFGYDGLDVPTFAPQAASLPTNPSLMVMAKLVNDIKAAPIEETSENQTVQREEMSQEDESELTSSPLNESEASNIEPLSTGKEELGESESSGNSETPHTLPIQAKLTIGEANDPYEQEADRVAAQVVQRIHAPETKTGGEGQVQRVEMGEDEEVKRKSVGESIQRVELSQLNAKSDSGNSSEASAELEGAIEGARGGGQPLDESVKEPMEREFGADFSGVRVHTDAKSDELNQSIQAKAFTTGQDVFFREGAYEPGSRGGQELLAHELTHVVQQKGEVVMRSLLQQQISDIGTGTIQRSGAIRFANVDTSKPKYQQKADDIIDTLRNTPVIQRFLAQKNVLITLKLNLSAGAIVRVVGEQVQIELSPWFFEQQSRGRIIGMLAHELGVHPVAGEMLTAQERQLEQQQTTQQTPLPTGYNTDAISYDGSNQADHVFASLQGRERFNVYQETVYDMVSRMLANQNNTHITNEHISDVIMTYLADMAMILATNDHRGRLLNNLDRAAIYFNNLRTNWLAFLNTKQNNGGQLIALTPGQKTGGDVAKEVGGVVGSFMLSMFTNSISNAKENQQQNLGVWNPITQNQTEILGDYILQLQQPAFNSLRPSFFETLDAARNQAQGTTAQLAQQRLQGVLSQQNLQAADITKIQNYIIAITNGTYVGAVPDNLIYVLEQLLPYSIRVIAPNGQMAHYGNKQVVTLLLVPKPNEHYRYAS